MFNFNLTPLAVMEYLRSKGYKLTFNYDEMVQEAHHKSFTVAKVTNLDLLQDIKTSLQEAMESGKGFKEFKKDIVPVLKEKGWWGEVESINKKTGEVKNIYVGSRRLKHIFKTNARVAYNVGRCRQQKGLTLSVYLRYSAILDQDSRLVHSQAHGTVLHRDDAWWKTNYPPNGHGCRCKVRAYSQRQVEKRGWGIEKNTPPKIAEKDWDYNVGESAAQELDKHLKKKEKASSVV